MTIISHQSLEEALADYIYTHMADTIRTKAEILALLADNQSYNISPQDMRDAIVTIYNDMSTAALVGPYLYVAFALDSNGTGFTTTINAAYDYIAILNSPQEILSLQQSDFNGLWIKYKNQTPIVGSNVYIAYADDNVGTGFTTTYSSAKEWIGIIASPTPLTPLVSDFTGKWKNYTGNSEFGLLTPTFSRNRAVVTNQFLRSEDGVPTNVSPFILPWDAKLVAMSMSSADEGTPYTSWTAEVYVNGVALSGGTLALSGNYKNYNNLFSIDLDAEDEVAVYLNGTAVNRPTVNLIFRRR